MNLRNPGMSSVACGKWLVPVLSLFLCILTIVPLQSRAETESGFTKLESLFLEKKLEIDVVASKKKEDLLERYANALGENQKVFQEAGDLESVMIAREEIKAAAAGDLAERGGDKPLPAALQKFRNVAEEEIASILQSRELELTELRTKYADALESLKVSETKAGRLESAMAIAAEIERVKSLTNASISARARTLEDIPEPLRDGLVAWFPLDEEGDLVVTGSSSRELKGALEGTTFLNQGKVGGARSFNGSSDRIKLGNQIPDSEEITVALWVRSKNTPGAGGLFSDFTGANANDLMMALIGNNSLAIRADKNKKKLRTSIEFQNTLSEDWHHIAWVMGSASSTVYLDGKKVERVRVEGSNTGYHGAFLGFANDGNSWTYLHGEIDEFMMWNRALSARDVDSVYRLFQ